MTSNTQNHGSIEHFNKKNFFKEDILQNILKIEAVNDNITPPRKKRTMLTK